MIALLLLGIALLGVVLHVVVEHRRVPPESEYHRGYMDGFHDSERIYDRVGRIAKRAERFGR